jgi:protein O-GlcNAc transferase
MALCAMVFVALASSLPAQDAKALYARAVALETQGNHAASLPLLWEAAGLAPDDADIQNRLGEALDRIGALEAAIDGFRRARALRPDFRKAANNLVLTLVKAGRAPEAIDEARRLAAAAPQDPERLFTLGLAQSEADVAAAIATFQRVLALDPRHVLARYNLALVYKRADRLDEGVAELTRLLAIEPRAEAHYTLGVIYWHQGHLDRAVTELNAAIARNERDAEAHVALGAVHKARGDLRGARAALERAVALRPDLWSAQYALAQVLQLAGDERAARARRSQADQLRQRASREQEAGVWTAVGAKRLDERDVAGAIECFRRATSTDDAYAPAHYQLGRALRLLGRDDEARQAFARAQALNPSLVPPEVKR